MKLNWASLVDRWSEAVWVDYVAAAVVVAVHGSLVIALSGSPRFTWPSDTQRLAVYNSGGTVVSIIVGVSAVAIPVYLAAGGERAKAVRRQFSDEIRKNWRTLLVGMGLAAGLCLLAQVVDRPLEPVASWFTFELAMAIAVTKFLRLIWLFNEILRIADRDLTDVPKTRAPELSHEWRRDVG